MCIQLYNSFAQNCVTLLAILCEYNIILIKVVKQDGMKHLYVNTILHNGVFVVKLFTENRNSVPF